MLVGGGVGGGVTASEHTERSKNRHVVYFVHKKTEKSVRLAKTNCSTLKAYLIL